MHEKKTTADELANEVMDNVRRRLAPPVLEKVGRAELELARPSCRHCHGLGYHTVLVPLSGKQEKLRTICPCVVKAMRERDAARAAGKPWPPPAKNDGYHSGKPNIAERRRAKMAAKAQRSPGICR